MLQKNYVEKKTCVTFHTSDPKIVKLIR